MGELRKQIEIQNLLMEELERGIREHKSMVDSIPPEQSFFNLLPFRACGLMEYEYNKGNLSDTNLYDVKLSQILSDEERESERYSQKRLELTEREFLNCVYQTIATLGYNKEWLEKMYQNANNNKLTDNEFQEYITALKKIYLALRTQGFNHYEIRE